MSSSEQSVNSSSTPTLESIEADEVLQLSLPTRSITDGSTQLEHQNDHPKGVPIVFESDKRLISSYHFTCMEQLILCRKKCDESKLSSSTENKRAYVGGVQCYHCAAVDKRSARSFYSLDLRKFKSSGLVSIQKQLPSNRFTSEVRETMHKSREVHRAQQKIISLEERDLFWGTLWARIRYADYLGQDLWENKIYEDIESYRNLDAVPMPPKETKRKHSSNFDSKVSNETSNVSRTSSPSSMGKCSKRMTSQSTAISNCMSSNNASNGKSKTTEEFLKNNDANLNNKKHISCIDKQEVSKSFISPWNELELYQYSSDISKTNIPAVYPEDGCPVTPFQMVCMMNITLCRYNSTTRSSGQVSEYPPGYGGVRCKYCLSRAFFSDRLSAFKSGGVSHIVDHMLTTCTHIPDAVKKRIDEVRREHVEIQRTIPLEIRNTFWKMLWARVRCLDKLSQNQNEWMTDLRNGRLTNISVDTSSYLRNDTQEVKQRSEKKAKQKKRERLVFEMPASSSALKLDDGNRVPVIYPSDRNFLTEYHYSCLSQLVLCKNESQVSQGKHVSYSEGYGGVRCVHCLGKTIKPRSFYSSDLSTFRNSGSSHISEHLYNCPHVSLDIKSKLKKLRAVHKIAMRNIQLSDRNVLWRRLWARIRSVDNLNEKTWTSDILKLNIENPKEKSNSVKPRFKKWKEDVHPKMIMKSHLQSNICLENSFVVNACEVGHAPFYDYAVLQQMKICKVASSADKKFPERYGGLCCLFCNEHGEESQFFFATIDSMRYHITCNVSDHLMSCVHVPDGIKTILSASLTKRNDHLKHFGDDISSNFWSMVWRRIHFINKKDNSDGCSSVATSIDDIIPKPNARNSGSAPAITGISCDTLLKLMEEYQPTKLELFKNILPPRGQMVADYFSLAKQLAMNKFSGERE